VVKQRKKQQAIKRQQQQMSPEEIQEQQQLLQSKIRQEIQQMKSKLAVNKRPKPNKSNSPAKMKKSKDGGFFRKHLEEKLRMQDLPVETEYDTYEEDEEEGDYDYEDRSSENSATTSKKHVCVLDYLLTTFLYGVNDIFFTFSCLSISWRTSFAGGPWGQWFLRVRRRQSYQ
jgi:hypothetical protein